MNTIIAPPDAALADLPADLLRAWVYAAAGRPCLRRDPEEYFPTEPNTTANAERIARHERTAERICRHCPVSAECLALALVQTRAGDGNHGIWGGTTERQREAILRERHGTAPDRATAPATAVAVPEQAVRQMPVILDEVPIAPTICTAIGTGRAADLSLALRHFGAIRRRYDCDGTAVEEARYGGAVVRTIQPITLPPITGTTAPVLGAGPRLALTLDGGRR